MIVGDKQNTASVLNVNGKKINNSREIELLGIVIENELKFKKHVENLRKKLHLNFTLFVEYANF